MSTLTRHTGAQWRPGAELTVSRLTRAIATTIAVGLSVAVQAQTADPSATAEHRLGPLAFNPGFVFSSGYDTNAYRVADSEPDFETYAIPQLEGWLNLGRMRSNVFGAIELVRFASGVGVIRNHQYGARNQWQGGRLQPYVDVASRHTNANPVGFEVGRKSMRNETDLRTGLRTALGSRVFASAYSRFTKTDWDADAIYQTSSLREKLNRTDKVTGVAFEMVITPLTVVSVTGDANTSEFVFSPIRNGSGYRIAAGTTIRGPAAINGSAEIGFRSFESQTTDLDFRGLVANALLVRPFPNGRLLAVRYGRDIQFSYEPSLQYFVAQSVELSAIQPLGEKFSIQGFIGSHNLTYIVDAPEAIPVDNVFEYGLAVGHRLARAIRIGVSAESARAAGSQPWTELRITAFLTYGFGGFQRLDRPIPFQR
jgi:hypothetical protein